MSESKVKIFSHVLFLALMGALMNYLLSVHAAEERGNESKINSYERLRKDILGRPVAVHKMPPSLLDYQRGSFNMSFQLWLVDISDIDELNQIITVNAYVDISWSQKELSWNSSDYGGINLVLVDESNIWTPVILVVMGQKNSDVLKFAKTVQIMSNGDVTSTRHNFLTFTCNIDFVKYPFDVQVCSVGFLPTGPEPNPAVRVTDFAEYPLSPYITVSGEWLLQDVKYEIVTTKTNVDFPRYNFTMSRGRTYYVITFIFPMVLTSMMIPLTFLIPAQTGEKISYIVALFTSTAIFLNYISDVMPKSLSRMPYLAVLLIEVLIEGMLAVLASVMVIHKYLQEKNSPENLTDSKVSPKDSPETDSTSNTEKVVCEPGILQRCLENKVTLKMTSSQLDRWLFYVFAAFQTVFLLVMFVVTDWLWDSRPW